MVGMFVMNKATWEVLHIALVLHEELLDIVSGDATPCMVRTPYNTLAGGVCLRISGHPSPHIIQVPDEALVVSN